MSDLFFVILLGLLVFTPFSERLLGDAGIGWHIRTGQRILATHSIPRTDPFSATMMGKQWFAWEWLFDLAVGRLESVAGLNGVVLFPALIIASVFSWTFRLMVEEGTHLLAALMLILLAVSASMIHLQARPHVVTWLFTVAWLWTLDASESRVSSRGAWRREKFLWLLPALMLVWVNVHGGWLVGFVLLGIYWVGSVWTWFGSGRDRFEDAWLQLRSAARVRQLMLVGLVSVLATFANPYRSALHVHIYQYLTNRFLMDHIDEFQSPNFHHVAQRCFAGLLLLALVALGMKVRQMRLSRALVVLFAVSSGLLASRNLPVSSLLLVVVIGPMLCEGASSAGRTWLGRRWRSGLSKPLGPFFGNQSPSKTDPFSDRMRGLELSLRGHAWPVVAVLMAGWIAFHGGRLGPYTLMDTHFDAARFPVSAVSFVQRDGARDAVLCPDYWGGYLIYRLHPAITVVADDRHDLYGEEFFKSYLKMVNLAPDWGAFLREQHVTRILMPKRSPLANILVESTDWNVLYQDDVALLFERARR